LLMLILPGSLWLAQTACADASAAQRDDVIRLSFARSGGRRSARVSPCMRGRFAGAPHFMILVKEFDYAISST
jgi:hypothetical protein